MFTKRITALAIFASAALGLAAAAWKQTTTRGTVEVILHMVQVEHTKSDGSSWDALHGKPDLRVSIRSGRKQYLTALQNNVYEASYNAKAIRVGLGDVVEIAVRDQDVAIDDVIGSYAVTITAGHLREGRVTWGGIGRVKSLDIEFRR